MVTVLPGVVPGVNDGAGRVGARCCPGGYSGGKYDPVVRYERNRVAQPGTQRGDGRHGIAGIIAKVTGSAVAAKIMPADFYFYPIAVVPLPHNEGF